MLSLKPDFAKSDERYRAFWAHEIIDRPPVSGYIRKQGAMPFPKKQHATLEQRWLDIDYRVDELVAELESRVFVGDSIPLVWPNLGPELYSAWCGCGYEYGEDTTWSEPCVTDWVRDGGDKVRVNWQHPLFKTLERFTQQLLERGAGRFFVGYTDLHPGGDHLAALRNPQDLAIDMLDDLDAVKDELAASYRDFFEVYDHFYHMLDVPGNRSCSWMGDLYSEGRFGIVSNDFSCMISKPMFDEVFLPGIQEECRVFDKTIYHLDGPDALRHLDSLLAIPELGAVQWVCGAGNEGLARWIPVYQKIQAAGKSFWLPATLKELPLVFEHLRPEGAWISLSGLNNDEETFNAALARIERWA